MKVKLNNGITVDINPDTQFYREGFSWTQKNIKGILMYQHAHPCNRKHVTSLVHALIFQAYRAIVVDTGYELIREVHCTGEECQKRIRHLRYLRMKSKKEL